MPLLEFKLVLFFLLLLLLWFTLEYKKLEKIFSFVLSNFSLVGCQIENCKTNFGQHFVVGPENKRKILKSIHSGKCTLLKGKRCNKVFYIKSLFTLNKVKLGVGDTLFLDRPKYLRLIKRIRVVILSFYKSNIINVLVE